MPASLAIEHAIDRLVGTHTIVLRISWHPTEAQVLLLWTWWGGTLAFRRRLAREDALPHTAGLGISSFLLCIFMLCQETDSVDKCWLSFYFLVLIHILTKICIFYLLRPIRPVQPLVSHMSLRPFWLLYRSHMGCRLTLDMRSCPWWIVGLRIWYEDLSWRMMGLCWPISYVPFVLSNPSYPIWVCGLSDFFTEATWDACSHWIWGVILTNGGPVLTHIIRPICSAQPLIWDMILRLIWLLY